MVNTQTFSANSADILAKQRLLRPTSPHLTIYKAQITWYASGLHRVTGVVLSGALYVWALGYLAAPYLGWHLESAPMAAAFAAWPVVAKVGTKLTLAAPFFFHCVNGLRHLAWDFGVGFAKKTVIQTGWAGVGIASVLTAYYSFLY
jgi:succinate dehydrogenase (ubiquinone) cytochrome b560 subunit